MRLIAILLGLAVLAGGCDRQKAQERQGGEAILPAKGPDRSHKGKPAPQVAFIDSDGEEATLTDFRGRPLLVNLWATWCAPCVKELPTLDALAGRAGAPQLLAVSQDSGAQDKVAAFLEERGLERLEPYQDSSMELSSALGVSVLPTTILYDSRGREVWRFVGDSDWTSAEAAALLAEAS